MPASLPQAADGPEYTDLEWVLGSGCLAPACGCGATYGIPGLTEMPTEGVMRVTSSVKGYWSPAQASAEFRLGQEWVDPWGTPTYHEVTELDEAYSTGCCNDSTVVFTHGPFIASVSIADASEDAEHTQEAIDLAVQLDERLTRMFDS